MRAWSSVIDGSPTAETSSRTRLICGSFTASSVYSWMPALPRTRPIAAPWYTENLPCSPLVMFLLIAEIHHQRRDAQPHRRDLLRRGPMLIVNLDAAVDGRMVHNAARKRLVGIRAEVEILAQPRGDLRKVVLGGLDRREASWTFQAMFARGEAGLSQQRRGIAVLRGSARMKRLGHGPEHLAQTRRPASPRARSPRSSHGPGSFSSLPIAVAAPNTPAVPVMCQPTS